MLVYVLNTLQKHNAMDTQQHTDKQPRPDQTHGQELERTSESFDKGYPAPGTKHAGEESAELVRHPDMIPEKDERSNQENQRDNNPAKRD